MISLLSLLKVSIANLSYKDKDLWVKKNLFNYQKGTKVLSFQNKG